MTRPNMWMLSFVALCVCSLPVSADETRWIGGIGSTTGEVREWRGASIELQRDGNTISGRLKADNNRLYSLEGKADGDSLKIELSRRDMIFSLSGSLTDDLLSVSGDDPNINRLVLRRIPDISPDQLDKWMGVYQVAPGHRIAVRRMGDDRLAMTDFQNGKLRQLYPKSSSSFVAGTGISIADEVEFTIDFAPSNANTVEMRISGGDYGMVSGLRERLPDVRPFAYSSFDDIKIHGSLHIPDGKGPHPAIIWVHGSGMASRESAGSWPLYFSSLGFAVLAVDKRGVGESDGNYRLPDGGRDNFPHMRRRAKDVAAAISALRESKLIRSDRLGLVGASQAGWVIPMTTAHRDVAFTIILSGGATPLSVEGRFSQLAAEDDSGAAQDSVESLISKLREYEPTDPGIDNELANMDCASLWIYGLKDRSNPAQLCIELINEKATKFDRKFTVQAFPEGNHSLMICDYGGGAETRLLDRLVPDLHTTIEEWLNEQQLMPGDDR